MKKRIICLTIFICLLVAIPTSIWAITGGGTGDSGSGGGTGGTGTIANSFFYQFGTNTTAAYKFELAYFDKSGNREILGTVVAQNTGIIKGNKQIVIQKVKNYANYVNARYITSGKLVQLVGEIEAGKAVSDLFAGNRVENAEWILEVILDSNTGFGMSEADMQREQDQNPGNINSYGYRILIQAIQIYGIGGGYSTSFAAPRKEVANDLLDNGNYDGQGIHRCVQLFGLAGGYSRELYTEVADVHISNGRDSAYGIGTLPTGNDFIRWCNANGNGYSWASYLDKTPALGDWQNGLGYNILWFTTDPFVDFDYSVDMAYTDCDNTDPENVAYVIKDTSSWGAILNSGSSDNGNVQGYFNKGEEGHGNVFCRDEFTIYFPNANNQIYVDPGRYFVLYPEQKDLLSLNSVGSSTIPNLKPYKVYRKRECQTNLVQGEKESDAAFIARQQAALSSYEADSKEDFYSNMGTMYFKYNEVYEKSKYSMNSPEAMKRYDVYDSDPDKDYKMGMATEGKKVTMTMENTNLYKLPKDYYRYVRLSDGLSVHKMTGNASEYKDVGISNLPVSYENKGKKLYGTTVKLADIQFGYDLPSVGTKINQAVTDDSYLATKDPGENIYQQYINGDYSDSVKTQLENSACGILFGFGTDEFDECAKERVNDKTPDGGTGLSSVSFSTGSNYICKILSTDSDIPGNGCKTKEDADKLKLDWNSKKGYCCPVGTKYNSETGECDDRFDENACKTEADADAMGVAWNPKTNSCCPPDTTYHSSTGKCIDDPDTPPSTDGSCKTEEDAEKLKLDWNPVKRQCCPEGTTYYENTGKCLAGNEIDPVCPESDCPYGCCPSGECAPMPTINGEPYCPGPGGIDVIYRTIDLEDPFPGQAASNRETGSNWCAWHNGIFDCSYDNLTVKNVITRQKTQTRKDGSKVYDEGHVLYKITLDSSTIKAIRRYNDKNKYDDWNLVCHDNGKKCYSNFLKEEIGSKMDGLCYNVDTSSFDTCNKDV